MQLGELGSAMSELSQMLSQAIVLPFRRAPARGAGRRGGQPRSLPRAGGGTRGFLTRLRGSLWLAAGSLPDDLAVDLIHEVGGRRARALVLPVASYAFAEAGERYRRYLHRFGMERAETLAVSTRRQAEEPAIASRIAGADLIVLGGGQPGLLLDRIGGTPAAGALADALARGAAVVAFGPAVEAVGEWMLPAAATWTRPGPGPGPGGLVAGLGLVPATAIASAPHAAGRIASFCGAALTGGAQAILLDERTTLVVRPGWQGEVRCGTVLAVSAPLLPVAAEAQRARPRAIGGAAPVGGLWTRVAPVGWRLDLAARALLPPGAVTGAERP